MTIVNYFDKEKESLMIYENFELIDEKTCKLFFDDIYSMRNYNLECILNEGKIIIYYPDNFNGKEKYTLVICYLNEQYNFITEYICVYKYKFEQNNHINKITGNLDNYLQNLKLINNSQPIINDRISCKEIGTIIRYNINNNEVNNIINNYNNNYSNNSNQQYQYNNYKKENDNINNSLDISVPIQNQNNNIFIQPPLNITNIKSYFTQSPLIGLQNIGATCYMNATVQCFCHIEKFINFFKYNQQAINVANNNKGSLTYSFKLLIEKLWPNNYNDPNLENHYAPEEFKKKISTMNSLFEGVAANDAKDLVNFIIMTLHEELNKADKNNIINNNNSFVDQTNQQLMFNNFAQIFISQNKSIISDLFYAMNCNITQCGGCGIQTFNYQTYFFIVFPLEEVRKFKYNQFNNFNNNIVTIYDCFDYDRKINVMSGSNSMYCNYCKRNCNSSMCTLLTTGPEILILLLNRGKGIEFNVKILFEENLNLFNYIQFNNTGFNYNLIGVITHFGESGMSGHFIAYCKDPIYNIWYKYNDSIVTAVDNFQNEVISLGMPYLLFYQKFQ